jgi:two-component SAPR family response regulator
MVKIAGQYGLEDSSGQTASCAVEICFSPEAFPGFTPGTHLTGCPDDFTDIGVNNLPWPLKVYTLSRFSLVRDGRKVEFSGKVQQKPLTMLKVLIALGGRNISAARIMDLIWPDMEPELSHQSFKTTLHRLRRLLNVEQAVQFQEGCLSMDQRYCWADVWTFERLAGRVDTLRSAHPAAAAPEETTRLTDRALSLYSGNFLAEESGFPWALSTRERLRSKFFRLVVNAGYAWERAGVWHKAAEYYQKGLEIDDLVEEFYQRLLVCYRHLGKRGEALVLYNRCRTALAMQCITPAAKTRAAYEAAIND